MIRLLSYCVQDKQIYSLSMQDIIMPDQYTELILLILLTLIVKSQFSALLHEFMLVSSIFLKLK